MSQRNPCNEDLVPEKIQSFALVWMEMYKNRAAIPYAYFEDNAFIGNGMKDLGFTMDAGESIRKAFPDKNALFDLDDLQDVLNQIDLQTLGNAIYSKWRYFNHWDESAPGEKDYQWFIVAFKRLAELSGADC